LPDQILTDVTAKLVPADVLTDDVPTDELTGDGARSSETATEPSIEPITKIAARIISALRFTRFAPSVEC
jgi:hypothetical protein